MKAKLIVEGREFSIEINDPKLEKLLKPQKKTGYERVENGETVFYTGVLGDVCRLQDTRGNVPNDAFIVGNYYSDQIIAENNTRAEILMRQLRRFAVEHRESEIDWKIPTFVKYTIKYDHNRENIKVDNLRYIQLFGTVWFDSEEAANLAIETFRDELIWYFTEYKDSL